MDLIKEIPRYVTDADTQVDFTGLNFAEIAEALGYQFAASSKTRREVREFIYSQVRRALQGNKISRSEFDAARRHFLIAMFYENRQETRDVVRIFEIIRDATREINNFTAESEAWKTSIKLIRTHKCLGGHDPLQYLEKIHSREKSKATALHDLQDKGFNVWLENGEVILPESEHRKIAEEIESNASQLGIRFLLNLIGCMRRQGQPETGRYFFPRISEHPLPPWGYLFNLAVKHIHEKSSSQGHQQAWQEAIELATRYTVLLDVQEYSKYEALGQTPEAILERLPRMVLADQVYGLFQYDPIQVMDLIKCFFVLHLPESVNPPFNIRDYIAVCEAIIQGPGRETPARFTAQGLWPYVNSQLPLKELKGLLDLIAHEKDDINPEYLLPFDARKSNFSFKPLVKISSDHYLFADPLLFSFGFYEVISDSLRNAGLNEGKVGKELLEKYIADKFYQAGIEFLHGETYSLDRPLQNDLGTHRQSGECDFVIETQDTIFFIEAKKKILTRQAQSGDFLKIGLDIAKSYLDSQIQNNWHELILRTRGKIVFDSGNTLTLCNRNVEKLSMSLFDFMSLHDSFSIQQMLQNLIGRELHSQHNDPETTKALGEVNQRLHILSQQYSKPGLAHYLQQGLVLNCRFFNVFQLANLLKDVDSAETFKKAIWKTRHMTTGQKDWHFEHALFPKD